MAPDQFSVAAASTGPTSTGNTWQEIEGLVEEIARCAKSDVPAQQFYSELLDRAVRALAAEGGAVWVVGAEGALELQYQINAPAARIEEDGAVEAAHAQLLAAALEAGQPRLFPPHSGGTLDNGQAANPTEFLLITCPLPAGDAIAGLLEVFQRPGGSPAAHRGYVQLIEVMSELAADFHRNLELRQLRQRAAMWSRFDQFSRRVHGSLELDRVAYAIANEARRLLDCDRVSVAVRRGRGVQIRAVSGTDEVDRRSNAVRLLEQLVRSVLGVDVPLWHTGPKEELPPQIENALEAYLDQSHARLLGVVPLRTTPESDGEQSGETLGALVVEQFTDHPPEVTLPLAEVVAGHSASALRSALDYQNLPLMPVMRAVGKIGWFARRPQAPVLLAVLVLLIAGAAALVLVPGELRISGRGELQPAEQRIVFAPSDGIVERLHFNTSDDADPPIEGVGPRQRLQVEKDQVLIELRNSELDYELTRVQGDQQTAATQLNSVELSLRADSATRTDSERNRDLPARAEELKVQLKSLESQLEVLRERQQELQVKSPLAGELLTWEATELLDARPVRRGQALLTVADVTGDWVLELRVPDYHAGHVTRAWQEQGTSLQVEFKLKSDPSAAHAGTVKEVSRATDVGDDGQTSVMLTVALTPEDLKQLKANSELRPGATVVANVLCGEKPIGYVWLHDLIDAIRTWVLF